MLADSISAKAWLKTAAASWSRLANCVSKELRLTPARRTIWLTEGDGSPSAMSARTAAVSAPRVRTARGSLEARVV